MERKVILKKLEACSLTKFQKRVLIATLDVPEGSTITYKQLAKRLGHPRAYRAVGSALRSNPIPITIPCHRVVKSDGTLGNYSYGGTKEKERLLRKEGAV